jgi:hypothetical protein
MFEINGYTKDYYIHGKFVGYIKIPTPDRDVMGYSGRKKETLQEDTIIKKKTYKKGTEVITQVSPICGQLKGDWDEKINILANSRQHFKS